MNKELIEALNLLEKEKNISKATLLEAIENSLLTACKNHFGKADNIKVNINPETGDFSVYAEKEVVEEVEDPLTQISYAEARLKNPKFFLGDIINVPIESKSFGRIATQNAKNVILQKIREEERSMQFNEWYQKEKDVVTGIVQRYLGKNVSINLGKVDAILNEAEQVKGEVFKPTERIKVYVLEVKDTGILPIGNLRQVILQSTLTRNCIPAVAICQSCFQAVCRCLVQFFIHDKSGIAVVLPLFIITVLLFPVRILVEIQILFLVV